MTKAIAKIGCPKCKDEGRDRSNDNLVVYSDGHGYCFSCQSYYSKEKLEQGVDNGLIPCYTNTISNTLRNTYVSPKLPFSATDSNNYSGNPNSNNLKEEDLNNFSYQYIGDRGISKDTYRFYGSKTKITDDGVPVDREYPYGPKGSKVRNLAEKKFHCTGDFNQALPLYGMDKFNSGQAMAITITEGEEDAHAVYEMLGSKYPSVSVTSSSSARTDCEAAYDYINSFEKIYLCFDNDIPGQKAMKQVAGLFDPNKVYVVKMDKYKDANDYLMNKDSKSFVGTWYNSKRFMPKGIVSSFDEVDAILDKEKESGVATYPFHTLQDMTYGIRTGEVVLFKAKEKIGKTEVFRALEYHLLQTTNENLGVIHLEEEEKRTVQGVVSYQLKKPAHLPDCGLSSQDQKQAFRDATGRENRMYFYSHFGSDDPDTILDVIRYLVKVCKCKFIFLDHITMLVTGFENDDERRKLDYISTRLAMMTVELDFCLFMISHVNDNGDTRGSRNIPKVASLIINLERNIEADTIEGRNKTRMTVQGNRFASKSGPAGTLWFDPTSFTIRELTEEDLHDGEPFKVNDF